MEVQKETTNVKTETVTRQEATKPQSEDTVRIVFPVVTNPTPKALAVHCADVRFRKAFRNFIEGDASKGCLGFGEEDYVNLVIPGGVSSFSEAMLLPKQFKVIKEQIEFLLDHFKSIDTVILINHEDCAAYKVLKEKIGNAFLRRVGSFLERQRIDLSEAAKAVMGINTFKARIRLFMAKFANEEHTQVTFEEINL